MANRNSTVTPSASRYVIHSERKGDADGIRRVLLGAFGSEVEANLIAALRNNGALTISLVARVGSNTVGYAAFSSMHTEGQSDRDDWVGLAPVAVHPHWQRRGIGSALIQRGLEECRKRAVAAVFVLGAPKFYARFGFTAAHKFGIRSVYEAPEAFQILLLSEALQALPTGLVRYRPEFDLLP